MIKSTEIEDKINRVKSYLLESRKNSKNLPKDDEIMGFVPNELPPTARTSIPTELVQDILDILDYYSNSSNSTNKIKQKRKRICMFGGSFNPLTNMHMAIAQRAIDELKLDKLIFMPVNSNYESKHDELISGIDRINMIQGAISDSSTPEKFEVSDYEVRCISQPSTLETLRYLQSQYPDAEIYFLIGSDNLKTLSTWKGSSEILDEFQLIVTQREDTNIFQNVVLNNKYLSTHSDSIHIIPEYVTNNISSTTVRNLIKAGRNIDWVVPPTVGKYIKSLNLYAQIVE